MTSRATHARRCAARIREYAEDLTRWAPLPGGVIALVDRESVLECVTFGSADLERGMPMTSGRLFQIGSISKPFASLVLARLVDDGLLDLSEQIRDVLPWLDLGADSDDVTLEHLLTHCGGLIAGADAPPDDLAQAWGLRREGRLPAASGHFHYSNVGYILLGLAASARTQFPFPDLVQDFLLRPLKMRDSVAAITHDDRDRFAVGYVPAREDRPWVPGDPVAPAAWFETATADGNVGSTGADMARMAMLLLGRGEVSPTRVVSAARFDAMATPQAPTGEPVLKVPGTPEVDLSRYGLGINVEHIAGHVCLTHGGGMVGYSTFLLVDQDEGVGVVILTNSNGDNLHAQLLARVAHADLVDRAAGREPGPLPSPDPRVRVGDAAAPAFPSAALGEFPPVGASAGEPLTLQADAGTGVVQVGRDGAVGTLFRTLTGRFVTDHPGLRRFHLDLVDEGGVIAWVHGPDVFGSVAGDEAGRGRRLGCRCRPLNGWPLPLSRAVVPHTPSPRQEWTAVARRTGRGGGAKPRRGARPSG